MFDVSSKIQIDAPRELVWAILADLDAYRRWNPFLRAVSGTAHKGGVLEITVKPRGLAAAVYQPRVLHLREPSEMRWAGPISRLGLLQCETRFLLDDLPGRGTVFQHVQRYSGMLAGVMRSRVETFTAIGFRDMNLALKERAERAGAKLRAETLAA